MGRIPYNPKPKTCAEKECNLTFIPKKIGQKHCSPKCYYADNPKQATRTRIRPVSDKRKKEQSEYTSLRRSFLQDPKNKHCFVDGCTRHANTIEHQKGREGYADDWAREKGISLYLDTRYWKPCCLQHNLEFETNPDLAARYQLSKHHEGKKISKK